LFFQDQRAPCCQGNTLISNDFLGGTEMNLQGAIYFPNQEIKFSGGASLMNSCLQIIGDKVTFTGTSYLNATETNCAAAGVTLIPQYWVRLVE